MRAQRHGRAAAPGRDSTAELTPILVSPPPGPPRRRRVVLSDSATTELGCIEALWTILNNVIFDFDWTGSRRECQINAPLRQKGKADRQQWQNKKTMTAAETDEGGGHRQWRPAPLRSTRPPTATAADIDRVLGAIGDLRTQLEDVRGAVEVLGDHTQATEIRLDELAGDLSDIHDSQDAQAQVVAEIRSRTDRIDTILAEPPPPPRKYRQATTRTRVAPPGGTDNMARRRRCLRTKPTPPSSVSSPTATSQGTLLRSDSSTSSPRRASREGKFRFAARS